MENTHGYHQRLFTEIKKRGERTTNTNHSIPQVDSISIHFSCHTKIQLRTQDSSGYELQWPLTSNYIQITHQQLLNLENTYTTLKRDLWFLCWNISDYWCDRLTRNILASLKDMVKSVSPGHNVLDVEVSVIHIHVHTYDVSSDVAENMQLEDVILQLSLTESVPRTIPATDSSIESLETKIMNCESGRCEICTICLEEFITGCQAMCMPCSHVFHGDCIKIWLETSHYCPICRFEMPTS